MKPTVFISLLSVLVMIAFPAFAVSREEDQKGTISNQNLINDLKNQGAVVTPYENYTQVKYDAASTVYFFTMPNHPAHPFYYKALFLKKNGEMGADISGSGYGDKVEAEKWLADINRLVDTIKPTMKENQ